MTARLVIEQKPYIIASRHGDLIFLQWPGQSTVFIQIENLGHEVGYENSKKKPSTKNKLTEVLITDWNRIISPLLLGILVP